MPDASELNEILKGKKILSIEPGTTAGWMVINLEPHGIIQKFEPGDRAFLTVFIGGRNGSTDDNFHSTCALHLEAKDRFGSGYMIRDGRDPEMPMSSAAKAMGKNLKGGNIQTCNYEFEYEGEIDRCGSPVYVHGLCESHYLRLTTPHDPIAEAEQALKLIEGSAENP